MELYEKRLETEEIFKGKIITVERDKIMLENNKTAFREVVRHSGGVCIAALTDKNELIMVRQFRYPYAEVVLEVPAGKINYGEDPFECGKRELLEETGCVAESYTFLGKFYPSPGYCAEIIHIYLAENLSFQSQSLDEDEFLEVKKIPLDQAVEMVLNNEIPDGKTQAAIMKTYLLKATPHKDQKFQINCDS